LILDKLIEKKDLLTYIEFRTKRLKKDQKVVLETAPERRRHPGWKLTHGRILELQDLKAKVHKLKDLSKEYWKYQAEAVE